MSGVYSDAVIVVTGGSSGIGLACVQAFASTGARVFALARSKERLDRALRGLGDLPGIIQPVECDVTCVEGVQSTARDLMQAEGRVDVVIASHGVMDLKPFMELSTDVINEMMEANYFGTVSLLRSFIPTIKKGTGRRIVIISSLASKIAPPYFTAYSASKAAMTGFAHSLRQELYREKIKVTVVHPGPVKTPLIDGHIDGPYYPLPPGVPIVTPDHVANRILRSLRRAPREIYIPRRFRMVASIASIWPGAVDLIYRRL